LSLSLYIDHNVPDAVARGLRRRSVDVIVAREDGYDRAPDDQLLQHATNLGRIVFTQDEDFLVLGPQWNAAGRRFAGIVFAHQRAVTIGHIVTDLQLIVEAMPPEEIRDRIVYLPL
jgi:hypothetical protein